MKKGRLLAVIVIAIAATASAFATGTMLRPEKSPAAARLGTAVIAPSGLTVVAGRTLVLDAARTALGLQP